MHLTKQDKSLIIKTLLSENNVLIKLKKETGLSKNELKILFACCNLFKENTSFECSEIQEKTAIHPNNIYDAMEKLENLRYIQKLTPTRQWYTAYRYTTTGNGMALLRKFYKELKAI